MSADERQGRIVQAVHGRQETRPDPDFEIGLSESLKSSYGSAGAGRALRAIRHR